MKYGNPSEEKFGEFLNSNSIVWTKPKEEYGDFYVPEDDILIEHKSLLISEFTKVIDKANASYPGPIKYVGAISSKRDIHSYDSVKDKLNDANTKAVRAKKDPKHKNSIFLCLLNLETGWDLKIVDLLMILQHAKFINFPFKPDQHGIYDQRAEEYFLVYKPTDGNNLLADVNYMGIIRKNEDLEKWKIEIIQKPSTVKRDIRNSKSMFLDFLNIIRPKFVMSMDSEEIKLTEEKFPILYPFAKEYKGNDPNDIRIAFRDKPYLLWGEEYWLKYEQALQILFQEDREYLFGRLRTATLKLSEEKGWPHFEEVLNEALAYEYLRNEGYSKVRFIKENEDRSISPDLKILKDDDSPSGLGEVKTVRFSDDEYKAVKKELETGEGRFLSMDVHPTLYKKIIHDIEESVGQLWNYNSSDLSLRRVYLFLNLDSGNLMDLIFTPQSDLELFLCKTIKELEDSGKADLKVYVLSGTPGKPVKLKCK